MQLNNMTKTVVIDECLILERPVGYYPTTFITVEEEIKDIFDKDNRLIASIIKFDGYKVYCSKKLRKDVYKKIKDSKLEKSKITNPYQKIK